MELLVSGPEGFFSTVNLNKDVYSIGRSTDNDLAFPEDPWLSRYHLCFERKKNVWSVKDCGSRNGTTINSGTLKEVHRLRPGDRILAGHLTIEVRQPILDVPNVVSFVPQNEDAPMREATIVTSLDKILGKTSKQGQVAGNLTLSTARVVRALIQAGQELAGHQPLKELFEMILNLALSAMEAKRGVILTLEEGDLVLRASKGEGFEISTAVRDRVLRDKCSLVITDAQLDDALRQQKSILMHRVRSIMAVPLQTGDRVIGLIYVDNGAFIRSFSQEDLDLLTVLANVAAIRIEHARLASIEQKEQLMASDLAQASEIQQSLLPSEAPLLPGFDMSGYNLACRTVGGDYYDFLPYGENKVALVIGDVSGKGLPAALMMSSLQARVQMLIETRPDPASAVTTLNRNLAERCPLGKFITFFYAVLNTETGELTYSNAGHNPPLLLRSTGQVEMLPGGGLIMGLFPSIVYGSHTTTLEPGDMLALFSDGVTEARNADDQELGELGLAEFLLGCMTESCSTVTADLAKHVREWCGTSSFADDFTIVLVKRLEYQP